MNFRVGFCKLLILLCMNTQSKDKFFMDILLFLILKNSLKNDSLCLVLYTFFMQNISNSATNSFFKNNQCAQGIKPCVIDIKHKALKISNAGFYTLRTKELLAYPFENCP